MMVTSAAKHANPSVPGKLFIPAEQLRQLTTGSYEHLAARVEAAVKAESTRLFGEKLEATVVGTFTGFAMVLAENGQMFRLRYEEATGGEIRVVGCEKISAAVYTENSLPEFVRSEAQAVIAAFFQGDVSGGRSKLRELVNQVVAGQPATESQFIESVIRALGSNTEWKQKLPERISALKKIMAESFDLAAPLNLPVKFSRLYDGSFDLKDIEGFRNLVSEDVETLAGKLAALVSRMGTVISMVESRLSKLDASAEDHVVLAKFRDFAADLHNDLVSVDGALAEARSNVDQVASLGKLYDTLVGGLNDFEVACAFAEATASRIAAT